MSQSQLQPAQPAPFDQFRQDLRKILSVPKADVDAKIEEEVRRKKKPRAKK